MNSDNLKQIFSHYIDKFELINDNTHMEYYKWQIAKRFRPMMDEALACPKEEFADRLKEIKKLTENLIDSYTQPFQGLIEFAKIESETETVRGMFKDLYSGEPGNVADTQRRVSAFLAKSHELRAKYFPDSYLFKNDMHSVTGYLFLYDPDHNYFYKASHAKIFADCIEFYDDWGEGDSVKLSTYYRMCDQLVAAIKANKALLATDASRFAGGWGIDPITLYPASEKHILAFDIIYCCSTYGLFDGISFDRPKSKERQLLLEKKKKASELAERYEHAKNRTEKLADAKAFLAGAVKAGDKAIHKSYGEGIVTEWKDGRVTLKFSGIGEKSFGALVTVINGIIDYNNEELVQRAPELKGLLENENSIENGLKAAEKALEPYYEFLE